MLVLSPPPRQALWLFAGQETYIITICKQIVVAVAVVVVVVVVVVVSVILTCE